MIIEMIHDYPGDHDDDVLQMLLIIEMIILVIMMATLTQDVMVNIEVGT